MKHLAYTLEHTDWYGARANQDQVAITAFLPFKEPSMAPSANWGVYPSTSESIKTW